MGILMPNHRLLFASIHSYLDPSSGAALATRELLELLAARGWDCRALACGLLDYAQETPLEHVLAAVDRPVPRVDAALSRGGTAEVFDLELNGVRITLLPTAHSRADQAPSPREAAIFLDLADQLGSVPARRPADLRRRSRVPGLDAPRSGSRNRRGIPPAQLQRLWDDPEFEARHRALAKAESNRWDRDLLAGQYQQFFEAVAPRSM
jgi:hypothetical protein